MFNELKIAIIEDDEDDFLIIKELLQSTPLKKVSAYWVNSVAEAKEVYREQIYDVYFIDYRLGSITGTELLRSIQIKGIRKPVIMLTGQGTQEADLDALEVGAYDYLVKGEINAEKIGRSLRYALDRYQTHRSLFESELKYRQIFEKTLSFIFVCDQNLIFKECNPAITFFLGYTTESIIGSSLLHLIVEHDRHQFVSTFNHEPTIRHYKLKFISVHNENKSGLLTLVPFQTQAGEMYWQGIIHDETISSQAEQQKLLIEKLNTTESLIRTLAHEMRTPLTNIGLAADAIVKTGQSSAIAYTDIIERAGIRLNSILNEILLSARKRQLIKQDVDINLVLLEIMEQVKDRLLLRQINCFIHLLPNPLYYPLDKNQFRIAIQNIVVNAIESIEGSGGEITLSVIEKSNHSVIKISDNGIGMNSETVNRLFVPYFTTKKNGLGLGLVSTLSILESHQAWLDVDSQEGRGSTFNIYLPKN